MSSGQSDLHIFLARPVLWLYFASACNGNIDLVDETARMLTIRHFVSTDSEYRTCIQIASQCWPDEPAGTIEEMKFGDAEWRKDKLFQRFVLESGGQIVGVGSYLEPYWLDVSDKYHFYFDVLPEHEDSSLHGEHVFTGIENYVFSELAGRKVRGLKTSVREDKDQRMSWLQERGFTYLMRFPISKLQVADFDFEPYEGHIKGVENSGYKILSLDFLQAHDPEWHQKLYDAWVEIDLDVPSPDPPRPAPVEEFDKMLRHPAVAPDGWAVAVVADGNAFADLGPYVGISINNAPKSDPKMWSIWLTGVRRAHRRKGLATALKLRSIEWARERGIKEFETGNEENNPMYQINMMLGFKPEPAWQEWEKILAKD